jgi:hypothetical protein
LLLPGRRARLPLGGSRASQARASLALAAELDAPCALLWPTALGSRRGGCALRRPRAYGIGQDRNEALSAGREPRNWP